MWLVTLWVFVLLTLAISAYLKAESFEDEDSLQHDYHITKNLCVIWVLYGIIFFAFAHIASQIGTYSWMYATPHESIMNLTRLHARTKELLRCASSRIPEMKTDWEYLNKCVDKSSLYHIESHSLRGMPNTPIAFVVPLVDSSSIFVTPTFSSMNGVDKALTILHECSHTALHREDYAYVWERKFNTLTKYEHSQNADSLVSIVKHECVY